jgi:hypothetical protein
MLQNISRPGSSAAYCPMELLRMQWAFASSIAETIAHAVKVLMRLNIVKSAEMIIKSPAQKLKVL